MHPWDRALFFSAKLCWAMLLLLCVSSFWVCLHLGLRLFFVKWRSAMLLLLWACSNEHTLYSCCTWAVLQENLHVYKLLLLLRLSGTYLIKQISLYLLVILYLLFTSYYFISLFHFFAFTLTLTFKKIKWFVLAYVFNYTINNRS